MTARASLSYAPRMLSEPDAAAYLGVSATTLRGYGIPRKVSGARRLYDRLDLDAYASGLPYEGEMHLGEDDAACDKAFGVTS